VELALNRSRKPSDQPVDLLAALAEWRHIEGGDGQALVEVAAEPARGHEAVHVGARRGDHRGLSPSSSSTLTSLAWAAADASPTSSRKQGAALGFVDLARPGAIVTEEVGLQEVRRQRRAGKLDKFPLRSIGKAVDGRGNDFLSQRHSPRARELAWQGRRSGGRSFRVAHLGLAPKTRVFTPENVPFVVP
jgi:hypothetical protein